MRNTTAVSRRSMLSLLSAGIGGASVSGWFPAFAQQLQAAPTRKRHCILLWMSGGPSQTDTFDLKPDHENGGEFKEIQTNAPGVRFSEHLPRLAEHADKLAILRGMSTKEGDHGRGTYLMRTGYRPMGPLSYPSLGCSIANHLGERDMSLPANVCIGAYRAFNQEAFGPGYLGAKYNPLIVGAADVPGTFLGNAQGFAELKVESLERPQRITDARMQKRLKMWSQLQSEFLKSRGTGAPASHNTIYEAAVHLMNSRDAQAFDLTQEADEVRERYGRSVFGQGCLLARRLVERGVPFVEVSLGTNSGGVGWDTHSNIFEDVRSLSADLDAGWASLMDDLEERGLLESTTIIWMGEFGRTPKINTTGGRDHFPRAWTTVLAGGGIAGGQAYGKTSPDGQTVVEGQISVQDMLATVCEAVGIGGDAMNQAPNGRPVPIAEGIPISEVLA